MADAPTRSRAGASHAACLVAVAGAARTATEPAAATPVVVATRSATAIVAAPVSATSAAIVTVVGPSTAPTVVAAAVTTPTAPVIPVTPTGTATTVITERRRATRRRATVRPDVDLLAADDDALHRLELVPRQVRRELHQRMVEADGDATDVAPTQAGLIGKRAHDRPRLDVVPLADRDPVLRHVLPGPRLAGTVEIAGRTLASVVIAVTTLRSLLLSHEELI